MAHILLLVDGSGGDVLPLMRIGGALKRSGHHVTLLTHCVYQERAGQAGLDFVALDSPQSYQNMLQVMDKALYPQDILTLFREHLLPQIPAIVRLVEQQTTSRDTVLVTSNTFSRVLGQIAAEKLGIPLIIMFGAPSTISAEPRLANMYGKVLAADMNRARAELGLAAVEDWAAWGKSFQQSIGVWPEWFAPPEPGWPARLALIGFMHHQSAPDTLPTEVERALGGEAPVLIAHGTSIPADARFFKASVEACQLLNYRAILVTRYEDLVPHPLPEHVAWFKQLPFDLLMPRVRAVIHHGGLGTAAQALAAARPQLVLPLGFDRPDNAARLRRLGVAEFLRPPQWSGRAIAEALYRLTHSPETEARCQEVAGRIRGVDPLAAACRAIEHLIRSSAQPRPPTPQPAAVRNVLLTTIGTWGDINPFLHIAQGLKGRGYDVSLLTHCRYEQQARRAGLDFMALDTPEEYEQFLADIPLLHVPSEVPRFFRRHVLPKMAAVYRAIVGRSSPPALLVTRAMPGMAAWMAAETLGIPLVSVLMAPSDLKTMPLIERAIGLVLGADLNRVRAELGLAAIQDWSSWLRASRQYIGIWPEWFAPASAGWSANLALVGFMATETATGDMPEQIRDVLRAGEQPVLITHGTSAAAEPKALAASAAACRSLDYRGLLVTPYKELVPDPLPAGLKWCDYAPFADLMPHLKAIIHHGGLGTLQQALAAGIPQLILPDSTERKENAICLQKLGAGDWLPRPQWQPSSIADALQRLVGSSQVRTCCQELAARIQAGDAVAGACDLIERMISGADAGPVKKVARSEAADRDSAALQARERLSSEKEQPEMAATLSPERRALLIRRLRKNLI